jgi:hypothetical protein
MQFRMIGEIFTMRELRAAGKLYAECKPGEFNRRVVAEIVTPALPRINKTTGQENDARYLGYALEYAFDIAKGEAS